MLGSKIRIWRRTSEVEKECFEKVLTGSSRVDKTEVDWMETDPLNLHVFGQYVL